MMKAAKQIPFIGNFLTSSIPEKIIDAYYRLQPDQPRKREDVPKFYVGKLHHYNQPYQVCIDGAYPLMIDYELLMYRVKKKDIERSTVLKYLKLYAAGFKQGYYKFETDVVKKKASVFNSDENYAQIIFDHVFHKFPRGGAFSETHSKNKHIFTGWLKDGIEAGYFYRAWYLILNNHKIFESFFSNSKHNPNTHRELCLAHEFKISAYPDRFSQPTAKEMKKASSKRYEAFLSLQKRGKYYKPVKKEEIINVTRILAGYPEAQKLASDYLKTSFRQ